jgi:Protein of unknown function (DUF3768)
MKAYVMFQTSHQLSPVTANPDTADLTTRRIRELNDAFRTSGAGVTTPHGRKMMTAGVRALGMADVMAISLKVITFNAFSDENDPWGEHDFGSFEHNGQRIFWKIDCYGLDMEQASPDPTDPAVTCRVLTVMLASEY